ncbi:MAG: 50S ribosomal protein L11 methyltransferase [Lactobacillales bacterium]|jgi:ribosomal protein L11 methyltransferase|nr:50S ribosomal protein L11 methyltransferase [Lactobacillales bacterium]
MKWTEVKATVASEAVEAVANIMMEAGASGVAIEDSLDLENYKGDAYGELLDKDHFDFIKDGAEISAYFPETMFLPEYLPFIKENITNLITFDLDIGENKVEVSEVVEDEWATAWKKYYNPVRVTRFLTVVPSWESYEAKTSDERMIRMDPGMAFGTGTHPTTRLTLQALETVIRGGETILDVGTGPGVLSIASKLLGAGEVYAYDLDQVAVNAAQENMDLNPAASDVHVAANDLLKGIEIQADVIVANILADIIVLMIEDAWRLLKPDGRYLVSGIIRDKREMIVDAMADVGFVVEQTLIQGDWVAMILKKPDVDHDGTIVGG